MRRGRLGRGMEPLAAKFTSSMQADVRIFSPVVQINLAHTIMLAERGIISKKDAVVLLRAFRGLQKKGVSALDMRPELEDIHMAVEEFVVEATDEATGGKLHTAKSRNDQVAAAIRMTLRKELLGTQEEVLGLMTNLIKLAEKNTHTIMPGYTHLQVAQPTTFAHHLAAYAWAFVRDVERLGRAFEKTNSCPMGACALAGTSFSIDRLRVARLLGFERVGENTMDAVSSRDFALEAMTALAILMTNLSRLAEELVLWSSIEFDMIEMPEEFATTSSIMPQKKNPVVAELVRAKTGRVLGNLLGALSVTKALPQSYNLDLQDFTPLLWNSIDETRNSVTVIAELMAAVKPKREIMYKRADKGFATATELADVLVKKAGLSFRDAHTIVGRMVARAVKAGGGVEGLNVEGLQANARELLGEEIRITRAELEGALDIKKCVEARSLPGGPAPKAVERQLKSLKRAVGNHSKLARARKLVIKKAEVKLMEEVRRRLR